MTANTTLRPAGKTISAEVCACPLTSAAAAALAAAAAQAPVVHPVRSPVCRTRAVRGRSGSRNSPGSVITAP